MTDSERATVTKEVIISCIFPICSLYVDTLLLIASLMKMPSTLAIKERALLAKAGDVNVSVNASMYLMTLSAVAAFTTFGSFVNSVIKESRAANSDSVALSIFSVLVDVDGALLDDAEGVDVGDIDGDTLGDDEGLFDGDIDVVESVGASTGSQSVYQQTNTFCSAERGRADACIPGSSMASG